MHRSSTGPRCKRLAVEESYVQTSRSQFLDFFDGYGAGPDQDLENPLGVGGLKVFDSLFLTRTWQRTHGSEDGENGIDDNVAAKGFEGIGAYILGRNMFGPVRGPWSEGPDE
jgi:hypothetical protein